MPRESEGQRIQAIGRTERAEWARTMNLMGVAPNERRTILQKIRNTIRNAEVESAPKLPGGRRRSTKRKSRKNRRQH